LREFAPADWQAVHEYGGDLQVCEFLDWGPNSTRETKEFIKRAMRSAKDKPRIAYDLAITLKGEDQAVGAIALMLTGFPPNQALIGFVLNRRNWSNGVMSEAVMAMIGFGFETLKLHRIGAICDAQNTASYRVMEKCGMRREAHFIQDKFVKGHWRDSFYYAMLANEWAEGKLKQGSS
jgi:RimJ/RimL family protein N-acetyltransferase